MFWGLQTAGTSQSHHGSKNYKLEEIQTSSEDWNLHTSVHQGATAAITLFHTFNLIYNSFMLFTGFKQEMNVKYLLPEVLKETHLLRPTEQHHLKLSCH